MTKPLTPKEALRRSAFTQYRKTALTPISDITYPPGTVFQTPEGLRAEDEETRCAFDVQGGIYPIRESVFLASYASLEAERKRLTMTEPLSRWLRHDPYCLTNPCICGLDEARDADRADPEALYVVFDGPPGAISGRFVEVETSDGRSVHAGAWEPHPERDDLWRLGPLFSASPNAASAGLRETSANCEAGDHDDCLNMVEQDAPEVGITDCGCACHTLREHPDGTFAYPPGHFAALAGRTAEAGLDVERLTNALLLVHSWDNYTAVAEARAIVREYAALGTDHD